MNESDLCHRQQVEAKDGIIRVYTGSGTTTRDVDVSTHAKRYEFCQDNRNNVYCEANPEGDAFTRPGCEGDPSACTVDDCEDAYEESDLYDTCSDNLHYRIHVGSSGGTYGAQCRITATCGVQLSDTFYSGFANKAWPLEDVDDLVFCENNRVNELLQVGSC